MITDGDRVCLRDTPKVSGIVKAIWKESDRWAGRTRIRGNWWCRFETNTGKRVVVQLGKVKKTG